MTIITSGFTVALKHSNGYVVPLTDEKHLDALFSRLTKSQIKSIRNDLTVKVSIKQEILISISLFGNFKL